MKGSNFPLIIFYGDNVYNLYTYNIISCIVTFYRFDAMEYTKVRSGVMECFQKRISMEETFKIRSE